MMNTTIDRTAAIVAAFREAHSHDLEPISPPAVNQLVRRFADGVAGGGLVEHFDEASLRMGRVDSVGEVLGTVE